MAFPLVPAHLTATSLPHVLLPWHQVSAPSTAASAAAMLHAGPSTAAQAQHSPPPAATRLASFARGAKLLLVPAGLLFAHHNAAAAHAGAAPAALDELDELDALKCHPRPASPYTGGMGLETERQLTYDGLSHFVD